MSSAAPLPPILVAEDDPNDLVLLQHALQDAGANHPIMAFGNGAEIIQFLRAACSHDTEQGPPRPRLLFLDLHMPQVEGCGVIAWIRKQKALDGLRVIVVSGSGDSQDMQRADALGADRLLVKPPTEHDLRAELARLAEPPPAAS